MGNLWEISFLFSLSFTDKNLIVLLRKKYILEENTALLGDSLDVLKILKKDYYKINKADKKLKAIELKSNI